MKLSFQPSLYYNFLGDELGGASQVTAASSLSNGNTLGAISAGSGLIGGIIDAFTANSRAHQAMAFSQQQAAQQRNWAIQDRNFALSDAPSMAMAGFKKAGLNTNLIYQQSTNSPTVRATPEAQYNPAPATLGHSLAEAIPRFQNAKIQSVQADNAALIGQNILQQTLNGQAELVKRNMENNVLSTVPGAYAVGGSLEDTLKDLREKKYARFNLESEQLSHNAFQTQQQNILLGKQITSQEMSNALQAATQESNITAGLQKGLQALMDYSKSTVERDNLRIMQKGLLYDNDIKKAEDALRNGGMMDHRDPVIQTFLRTLLDAALIFAK